MLSANKWKHIQILYGTFPHVLNTRMWLSMKAQLWLLSSILEKQNIKILKKNERGKRANTLVVKWGHIHHCLEIVSPYLENTGPFFLKVLLHLRSRDNVIL